jgi:cytochrome oxidase Cu insertion factor (SCO1/SenC/PrrC family)
MLSKLAKTTFKSSTLRYLPSLAPKYTLRPTYLTSTHLQRTFSKKIEDFVEDETPSNAQAPNSEAPGLENDPFDEDENSFYNAKKSSLYFFTAAALTMGGLYFIMQVNKVRGDRKKSKQLSVSHVGKAHIGGSWKLKDIEGKPFGSSNLNGKYYLIYFGFCNCPDVCPQSLYKLTRALEVVKRAPEKKYFDIETVFVTVDPDRDDKEAIQNFLRRFDKDIIAVTGRSNNDPALRDMMGKFKIYASKIELEDEQTPGKPVPYTLDHTIITYLMDQESQYLTHIGSNASQADIAQLIITKIMQNERDKLLR